MDIPMGIPLDIGIDTVMNPHGPAGFLGGFLNGHEIKQKNVIGLCDKCHSR